MFTEEGQGSWTHNLGQARAGPLSNGNVAQGKDFALVAMELSPVVNDALAESLKVPDLAISEVC